jgi:hypothetical protein
MSEVRCPHCQTVLPEKASFCAACGNRIEGWSFVPGVAPAAPQPTILPGGDEPTTSTQPTPSLLRAAALSLKKKKKKARRSAGWIYVSAAVLAAGATYYLARPAKQPASPPPIAVAPAVAAPSPSAAALPTVAAPAHAKKTPAHHPHRIEPVPMAMPKGVKGSGPLPHKSMATDSKAMSKPVLETVSSTPSQPSTVPGSDEEMKKEAEASLDADSIRFVVKSHLSQVHACYERAFKDASPGGRVEIGFAITPDGSAARVHTETNSTGSEALANCLEGRVRSWQFPRPVGGDYELIYPFVFAAGS